MSVEDLRSVRARRSGSRQRELPGLFRQRENTMTMRFWAALFAVMTACGVARAAETFPERQRLEGKDYVIEYSAGDEAYAQALAKQLPLKLSPAAQPAED